MRRHENYRELVWMLAKTDFKLRYHGSALGYVWALLKPLLTFLVLNYVFSSLFAVRGLGGEYYSLQLLVAILMFGFFSEGTSAGMQSLVAKSQLVTKIYVPRWTIILASTVNAALIYVMNFIVLVGFFAYKHVLPSAAAIGMFLVFSLAIYLLVVSFSFITAPLFVRLRDLAMIWEVLLQILFYATPIFYSLTMMPANVQQILLLNPMAFIIHFTKESLTTGHFAELWQYGLFAILTALAFALSLVCYKRFVPRVAEEM